VRWSEEDGVHVLGSFEDGVGRVDVDLAVIGLGPALDECLGQRHGSLSGDRPDRDDLELSRAGTQGGLRSKQHRSGRLPAPRDDKGRPSGLLVRTRLRQGPSLQQADRDGGRVSGVRRLRRPCAPASVVRASREQAR